VPLPDLTTTSRVKGYLRSGSGISSDDTRTLGDLIRIASRLIRATTRRRFGTRGETPVSQTRLVPTYGSESVYIDELMSTDDLVSVTDSSGLTVPYEIDIDDYSSASGEPRGATIHVGAYAGMYESRGLNYSWAPDHADLFIRNLNLDGYTYGSSAGRVPRKLSVTAVFGWEEIPEDISFAATRAVALWFKEEIAHFGEDAFISRGQQFNPEELPPLTMAMLRGANWIVREGALV
jgi:hypothetical protein